MISELSREYDELYRHIDECWRISQNQYLYYWRVCIATKALLALFCFAVVYDFQVMGPWLALVAIFLLVGIAFLNQWAERRYDVASNRMTAYKQAARKLLSKSGDPLHYLWVRSYLEALEANDEDDLW